MTAETEGNSFTTIRIWREDKPKLDAMKVHDQQGTHEVIRALILTAQINDKVIIPLSEDDFLAVSKSDPDYKKTVQRYKDTARRIVEGKE